MLIIFILSYHFVNVRAKTIAMFKPDEAACLLAERFNRQAAGIQNT